MILTTVTDEVTEAGLEESIALAVQEGVTHFELRGIEGRRFPLLTAEDLSRLKHLRVQFGLTFTAVSPGIFKVPLRSAEFAFHRTVLLEKSLALAEELGISRLIVFGIKRAPDDREEDRAQVVEALGELAFKAGQRGFTVMLENEPGFWADRSENCLALLEAVNLRNFRLNWDPGNLYKTGEHDYKPGYERLKRFIANVHLKDAATVGGKTVYLPLGAGAIDYRQQLADLRADGYRGYLTVETHCRPLPETFRQSVRYLKQLLA